MYGENTNTIAIPIYRVLPYPVIAIPIYRVLPYPVIICSVYDYVKYKYTLSFYAVDNIKVE